MLAAVVADLELAQYLKERDWVLVFSICLTMVGDPVGPILVLVCPRKLAGSIELISTAAM